jgi:hypothetical protein
MAQTNLNSTDMCSYNISSAPFFYFFEPGQYSNTYTYGEVGLNAAGGSAGSYVRPDVIDVSSFLSGRDDILSRCNPPVPSLDDVEQEPLKQQNSENINVLLPKYTKEKKSAVDLSAIDYNRWAPPLPVDPQDLRFIIEDFAPQRGGLDSSNFAKTSWQPTVARGAIVNGNPNSCRTILDPSRACGEYCADVNGYMPNVSAIPMMSKPPGQDNYPFIGTTSQMVKDIGMANCGPNQFYGYNYDKGDCGPQAKQRVLLDNM